MKDYETVFVLHPSLDEKQVESEIEAVSETIRAGSGDVVHVERWGRRKLAYEVKKVHEGIYTLIRFRSDSQVIQNLERRYRLREEVLRHLTVVAHGPPPEPSPPVEKPAEGVDGSRAPKRTEGEEAKPEADTQTKSEVSSESPAASPEEPRVQAEVEGSQEVDSQKS